MWEELFENQLVNSFRFELLIRIPFSIVYFRVFQVLTDYIAEELQTIESDIEVLALNLREKSGQEKAQIYLVMDLTGSRIRSK